MSFKPLLFLTCKQCNRFKKTAKIRTHDNRHFIQRKYTEQDRESIFHICNFHIKYKEGLTFTIAILSKVRGLRVKESNIVIKKKKKTEQKGTQTKPHHTKKTKLVCLQLLGSPKKERKLNQNCFQTAVKSC